MDWTAIPLHVGGTALNGVVHRVAGPPFFGAAKSNHWAVASVTMTTGIFISYRRHEAIKDARAIYERLGREFGAQLVFMDLEGLEYGTDFVEALKQHLDHCLAMLVLIGPRWLAATDNQGRRRLDNANDFVRIEVRAALGREGVRVIPVLIDGAALPAEAELPEDLQPLVRRQALVLRDASFDADMRQLCVRLRRLLGQGALPAQPAAAEPPRPALPPQAPPQRKLPQTRTASRTLIKAATNVPAANVVRLTYACRRRFKSEPPQFSVGANIDAVIRNCRSRTVTQSP